MSILVDHFRLCLSVYFKCPIILYPESECQDKALKMCGLILSFNFRVDSKVIGFFFSRILQMDTFNPFMPRDKMELANSVVPDQTSQNAASNQGLHCLH